jgi:predicted outer membrane repeat protein
MKTFDFKKFTVFVSSGLFCFCAHSQIFQVITTADSGPGSLREAMTNALVGAGGTIVFTNVSGTINLRSALPDISGNLTILGNGPANTVINSYRTNRIFNVLAGANCNVSDLTVQGSGLPGSIPASTAIFNAGTMSISNCFLHDNGSGDPRVGPGGAISSAGGGLVLNNVVVSNNVGYGNVLGVYNVRATNCLFINNSVNDFAPIWTGGDSVFSETTFAGNDARLDGQGGGIRAAGNLTLLNCIVTNNFGDWSTGGIYFTGNNLIISNCVINNNEAGQSYGGIYAVANNILILNSSISGNTAENNGGITLNGNACLIGCTVSFNRSYFIYPGAGIAAFGTLNMTNCTVSGNWETFFHPGAGVYCAQNSTVQAVNCTIAYNGSGIDNSATGHVYALNTIIANNGIGPTNGDFFGTLISQGYNLIGNLTNTTVVGSTNGNIYGVDPLLGPLQNNGGLTLTHALLTGSPAIDAGARAGAPMTDQRGVVRHFGIADDIGAFESEYTMLTNEVRITGISLVDTTNVHLRVEGPPGSTCTIQASSNLLNWENVFVSGNGTGVWEFVDQDAVNHPNRFYRALIDN